MKDMGVFFFFFVVLLPIEEGDDLPPPRDDLDFDLDRLLLEELPFRLLEEEEEEEGRWFCLVALGVPTVSALSSVVIADSTFSSFCLTSTPCGAKLRLSLVAF